MSRDPCAPIIRGVYHARHARHIRHAHPVFLAASTVAVGCGGASATAVWLNRPTTHTVTPGSRAAEDWAAWARLQEANSGVVIPFPGTSGWAAFATPAPDPAVPAVPASDWPTWARLQESYTGLVVPFPGTPEWPGFVQTHPLAGVVPVAPVTPAPPVHVPEPASVAVMGVALVCAGLVRLRRRRK